MCVRKKRFVARSELRIRFLANCLGLPSNPPALSSKASNAHRSAFNPSLDRQVSYRRCNRQTLANPQSLPNISVDWRTGGCRNTEGLLRALLGVPVPIPSSFTVLKWLASPRIFRMNRSANGLPTAQFSVKTPYFQPKNRNQPLRKPPLTVKIRDSKIDSEARLKV